MNNLLLEKCKASQKTVGTFFMMGNPTAAECLGLAGLDYFIIDTEHGPFDVESTMEIVRAAELRETTPLVRVKDKSRSSILKMLDIGVQGIVVPNIKYVEEVKEIVKHGKYAPMGERGVGATRKAGFGYEEYAKDLSNYLKLSNEQTMILPQCETVECLENIEEIVAVEGVSGIFIGPFDLSMSMNLFGQFDSSDFKRALQRILKACKEVGKYCFIYSTNKEKTKEFFSMGFDSVAVGTDASVYINAYKNLIKESKE